jgi:hypothetical protein
LLHYKLGRRLGRFRRFRGCQCWRCLGDGRAGNHADLLAPIGHLLEFHLTLRYSVQGVVFTDAHVGARMDVRPALPDDDVPGSNPFAALFLNTQALGIAVATVSA